MSFGPIEFKDCQGVQQRDLSFTAISSINWHNQFEEDLVIQ